MGIKQAIKSIMLVIGLVGLLGGGIPVISQASEASTALMLDVDGVIGPAISEYIRQGLNKAENENHAIVILRLDTPGGLDTAMRDIIKDILASTVPVVTWVAPAGSRAASAGTYILYASHVAAMAPATNLGAATPMRIGGTPGSPKAPTDVEDPANGEKPPEPVDTAQQKMINDAAAYIRALADRHGRNADWAEKAVREAVSLTAEEALQKGVIDLMAATPEELLLLMDGREVVMDTGNTVLASKDLVIISFAPNWRIQLLSLITNPNIAYILLLIGIYGLILELANPGTVIPGVVGAICLLIAMYAFQILPVNYAGLALIILGIALMAAEAFMPRFGVLGIGGIISFLIGSIILMDGDIFDISLPLIVSTVLTSAGFIIYMMGRLYTVSRKKVITGIEKMIGETGEAMEDFSGIGRIWLNGESWQARCQSTVSKGQKVRVLCLDDLQLTVETIEKGAKK